MKKPWLQVQKDLGARPITEGALAGAGGIYAERYLYKSGERTVSGIDAIVLATLFGGSRVQERYESRTHTDLLPSQSMLVPARCPTRWRYSGPIDFAVFYFPRETDGIHDRLRLLTESKKKKLLFSDALVGATALQLVIELGKGSGADERFMAIAASSPLRTVHRSCPPVAGGSRRSPSR